MKVVVGSQNPIKIEAVRKAFNSFWPAKNFEFINFSVNSGVPTQPKSDEECIEGAINRAREAQRKTKADFGVGLEGGICRVKNQYFARAWMVVVNKKGDIGIGSTLSAPLPDKFMRLINSGVELGKVNDVLTGRKNTKHKEGYFGFISDNLITREKGYIDGVIMALAKFKKPGLFS